MDLREFIITFVFLLCRAGPGRLEILGDCSQPGLNCTVHIGGCLDSSWLSFSRWTPSFPKELHVNLANQTNATGVSVPVLSISWRLSTDASIKYSQGVEVSVKKLSNGEEKCVQYRFQNKIRNQLNPQGEKWAFSLERLEAEPEQTYRVAACSLPRPNINQDNDCPAIVFTVPGCEDDQIKYTEPCKCRGSLWNPNITHIRSEMRTIIFFQTAKYANKYLVFLNSYSSEGKLCDSDHQRILQESEQQVNITFSTEHWMQSCRIYRFEIQPFFIDCDNDCRRIRKDIPGPEYEETNPPKLSTTSTEGGSSERTGFFAVIGVLVFLLICVCIIWVRIKSKENETKTLPKIPNDEPAVVYPKLPQVKKKVLIIYSLDHELYKNVILAFAQFLMTNCGTEVTLDYLQVNKVAEVGHINWLTLHKSKSDKIFILCSRGTRLKWEAMLRIKPNQILLKSDERSPMRDMFTPAMSLILPDFKRPASFGKYIVAYFDDISSEEDIPDPFKIGVKYKLMKQFEEIYFRVQDLEKHEPGKTYRVVGITMDDYHNSPSGKKLKNAIEQFKLIQTEQPDWFEKECILFPEEAEAEPLLADEHCELLPMKQNIVKYKPLDDISYTVNEVQIVKSSDEILVRNPVGFEHKGQDYCLFQNLIGVDCNDAQVLNMAHTLEPLCNMSVSGCSQSMLICPNLGNSKSEGEPHLEKHWMLKNDVSDFPQHSCEGDITMNEISAHSGGISHDVKKRLEEFQQMLLRQSLSSPYSTRSSDLQSGVIGCPHSLYSDKEESVDSDEGYISKQSASVVEIPTAGGSTSSEALNELKILQMALLNESMCN
ncbi:interleukin 17 receptor A1a [Hemiscyllium ocellatum]|uniref:interleukin 17 receptor A1a n=1 Tax=Hemiscyllium ocellatum TaxID=170820 RepID=UPI002966DB85|nr:interleukin 17 receptor A1a [Hemiscyllium ocellatum]